MSVGGSIESVSIKGRNFAVAADAEGNRKLGGFENAIEVNGNGTKRTVQTRVGWKIDGLTLSIDDDRGDHEFLQDIADSGEDVPIAATFASGATYGGAGTITGEIMWSSQNTTAGVTLEGGGKLKKQ